MKIQIACAALVAIASIAGAGLGIPTSQPVCAASRDPAIQRHSGEWMVMTRDAEAAIEKGKFDVALQKYNLILEQRKNLGLDLMIQQIALADVYEKMKQLGKADQFHRDAIAGREAEGGDDDPTLIFPIKTYGEFLKRIGKAAEAAKQMQRIAYIEKQRTQPPKELMALIAQKTQKTQKKGLKNSEMAAKAVEIGNTYMGRDQERRALMAFQKAVDWDPSSSDAYAGRAEAYARMEDRRHEKQDLDKAIKLNPKNARALYVRGILHEGDNKTDLALADFNAAITANPLDTEVIGWRAKMFQNQSKFDWAIRDYERVLALDPNATWALMQRGLCFEGKKMYDQAAADFSRLAEIFPDDSTYTEAKARVMKLKAVGAKTSAH